MHTAGTSSPWLELRPGFTPRPQVRHVLFDFDGTLSLIREGWPEVMLPMFMELLPRQSGDTEASVRQLLYDDIMQLNGKQTIYQMIRFAERVRERIGGRVRGLAEGRLRADDLLLHGSRDLLERLAQRGLRLYLASGTDEQFVLREARLLGVDRFFGPRIYGALDDYKNFSKKLVIERILRENQVPGDQLLAFGDGYVEIQNTKEAGGLAVAVASDEAHNGSGRIDEWKRERLLGVGADVVIPDFREPDLLLETLLGTVVG